MEAIDKLIYNLLSVGESTRLPEVGTLRVEQSDTTQRGNSLIYGSRRIRFSSRSDKGVRSLVAVMVEEYGLSESEATEAYNEWLRVARNGSEVTIEGVGSIRKGFFTPAETFEREALNPWQPAPVTLRRRRAPYGWIFAVCVALGAVGAWIWLVGSEQSAESTMAEIAEDVEQDITEEAIVASLEEYAAVLESEPEQVEPQQAAAPVATPTPQPEVVATPAIVVQPAERTAGRSVVVAGVFSTSENADKFIAEDELGVGTSAYSKHPYGSKILVAVGGVFDNAGAANAHRRTLPATNGSLWVYTFK